MFRSPQYEKRNLKGKIEGFTLWNKSPRAYGKAQTGKYRKMLQRRNQDQSGLTRFNHMFSKLTGSLFDKTDFIQ